MFVQGYLLMLYMSALKDLQERLVRETLPSFVHGGRVYPETDTVLARKAAYREIESWVRDKLWEIEKAEFEFESNQYQRSLSESIEDRRKGNESLRDTKRNT